jgi:hypothetical protein
MTECASVRDCAGVCGRTLEVGVCECAVPLGPRTTHSPLPGQDQGQLTARTVELLGPREIPCPVPDCQRRAQLCGQTTDLLYFRCHKHGAVQTLERK